MKTLKILKFPFYSRFNKNVCVSSGEWGEWMLQHSSNATHFGWWLQHYLCFVFVFNWSETSLEGNLLIRRITYPINSHKIFNFYQSSNKIWKFPCEFSWLFHKTMISAEKSVADPVFVPPRKRQTTKKPNGVQNYVDHIVCAQVSQCCRLFISNQVQ